MNHVHKHMALNHFIVIIAYHVKRFAPKFPSYHFEATYILLQ